LPTDASPTDTSPTPLTLMYFAWVREKIGKAREDVSVPPGVATIEDLIGWLKSRGPEYENAFAQGHVIRAAINQTHVKLSASLVGARDVAFFPPVTGG
jgi:sulfur-carrier protein